MADLEPGEARDWAVAYLVLYRTDDAEREVDLPIAANAEFDIGRARVHGALGYLDSSISKHHLRIHCVNYGENTITNIEPMAYIRSLSKNGTLHITKSTTDGSDSTSFLRRDKPSVMLNHGDILHLSSKVHMRYEVVQREGDNDFLLSSDVEAEAKYFEKQYTIEPRAIGAGGFARVYLANDVKARHQVACKIVPIPIKPPVPSASEWDAQPGKKAPARDAIDQIIRHRRKCQELRREFEVLKGIDHPNIIRLEKVFYAESHIYIFQELVSGGDLLSYLEMKGALKEPEAAVIIFQLLRAVECLHAHGIVHRDIKPENILLASWRQGARVVLTDFGQSTKMKEDKPAVDDAHAVTRLRSLVGTYGYSAPEVYRKPDESNYHRQSGYTEKIDVWSIGCLAGTLLTNTFLFPRERSNWSQDDHEQAKLDGIDHFDLSFLHTAPEWRRKSVECKDFIRSCVEVNEIRRMTVSEALKAHWMTHQGYQKEMWRAYSRAIIDWESRTDDASDLIEYLRAPGTSTELPKPWHEVLEARPCEGIRSHHFPHATAQGRLSCIVPSTYAGMKQQARLPPISGGMKAPAKKPITNVDAPASKNDPGQPITQHRNKHPIDDEMSYLSIQDYAPPATLPASIPAQQDPPVHTDWQTQLAQSMDLDAESASRGDLSPHKRLRV